MSLSERLKRIQKALGLKADGILGVRTMTAIENHISRTDGLAEQSPCSLMVSRRSLDRLIEFEVSSERYYREHLQRPYWPGGSSGPTIGIGYDCGHQTQAQIAEDWRGHVSDRHLSRLQTFAGVTGAQSRSAVRNGRGVLVTYDAARAVFHARTLPRYAALTRETFPGIEHCPADAQGAVLSLVYNRGGSMKGKRRAEMRALRDAIADGNKLRATKAIWAMRRLWPDVPGLQKRREAEARMIARSDRVYSDAEIVYL